MSEFTAVLWVPQPPASAVSLLKAAGSGGVLPVPDGEGGQASVLLVPWAGWEALIAAAPQVWAYHYGADEGTLVVRGYRTGDGWLRLDFTALSEDPLGLDELLDEEGLFRKEKRETPKSWPRRSRPAWASCRSGGSAPMTWGRVTRPGGGETIRGRSLFAEPLPHVAAACRGVASSL